MLELAEKRERVFERTFFPLVGESAKLKNALCRNRAVAVALETSGSSDERSYTFVRVVIRDTGVVDAPDVPPGSAPFTITEMGLMSEDEEVLE